MIIFELGRQPEFGLAELAAVYGQTPVLLGRHLAGLNIDNTTALAQARHLGSIIKVMRPLVAEPIPLDQDSLAKLMATTFAGQTGKLTIGVSLYDQRSSRRSALNLSQTIRTILREQGHSIRLLPTTGAQLSTAAVLHNGLARQHPRKVELDFLSLPTKGNGSSAYLPCATLYVQDIDDYTRRDRRRPRRDAHNGMLPPKLAQTMINLARGATHLPDHQPPCLLDQFCGTGVVLIEASLMGLLVRGSEINTATNLAGLADTYHQAGIQQLTTADATEFDWRSWSTRPINLVVSETYLGRPYTTTPSLGQLRGNITDCDRLIDRFFANLAPQLPTGAGLCVAVPVWYIRDHIHHLPCLEHLTQHQLTNMTTGANLIYHRSDQIVGRELLVLQKR